MAEQRRRFHRSTAEKTGKGELHIAVDIRGALDGLQRFYEITVEKRRDILIEFAEYMRGVTLSMFETAGALGAGEYRGVDWTSASHLNMGVGHHFAPQRMHKDGTIVPGWGGTQKPSRAGTTKRPWVNKGLTLGRKRHSGKRVQESDRVMTDDSTLRNAAGATFTLSEQAQNITISTVGVPYATQPHIAARPFLFFHNPDDLNEFRRIAIASFAGSFG